MKINVSMHLKATLRLQVGAAVLLGLAGCGGSGGSGGTVSAPGATTPVAKVGVFLDSPVQGLRYSTPTQSGTTDANGNFYYLPGETIAFSLGNVQFGASVAGPVLTPLDLAATTLAADQRVTNMLVLLQSLDADANVANGISIPSEASTLAPAGVNFNVTSTAFRSSTALVSFLERATAVGRAWVSDVDARLHFQNSLNAGLGSAKINIAPYAVAGINRSAGVGEAVPLDGSASADANGDALGYRWSMVSKPAGSSAALTSTDRVSTELVPDVAGDYLVGLVVSDGTVNSPIAVTKISVVADSSVPAGYSLVWSDEFNNNSVQLPDASKWNYDVSQNRVGWFNNELQYYANGRLENSAVQNGVLTITARKENLSATVADWGGQSYTSARLYTKGKATWTYGFFEIRAKLPCGAGTWPAIWALGSSTDIWPDQGEIDIMEQTGWDKTTTLGTIHTLAGFGGNGSTASTRVADACTAFHNYQIKWTPDAIAFYVDGVSYRQPYTKPANASGWPFDRPQYLLLNVAVGGVLGGLVNDATLSATGMEVDYVRVYQVP